MNEAQTRLDLIDPMLRESGWGVIDGSRIRVEFPITDGKLIGHGKRGKSLSADYVLEYRNRRLATIEAKARDCYYTEGVAQAKNYANKLNIRFTYATNGLKIYSIDMLEGTEGDVSKFPTPNELWEMTHATPQDNETYKLEILDWKKRFDDVSFAKFMGKYSPRYYQRNAIQAVLDAIAEGQDRLLLTMATGTGKTAVAFHICWKLFHAKWNLKRDATRIPRILFLADRNILADQAFNSFSDFEKIDDNMLVRIRPKEVRKTGKAPTNGSIFFTIFQSFLSGETGLSDEELEIQEEQSNELSDVLSNTDIVTKQEVQKGFFGQYPSDFFDFIVIDECHRGGANDESSWRGIMEHFSEAVQLGLTATPRRDVNADTYEYFGEPLYTYALKEGINDGFLSPFRVHQISTTIDNYTYTAGDTITGGEIDESKEYTEDDINRHIEIKQREEYRVKKFLSLINQNHRTLVFCSIQRHAALIRDLINQHSDSKHPDYCHRVTADDGALGEQHLKDFQDDEKSNPVILTTSKKLSTGVDAPEIRNIVLLRPVKSMVEFKQIIGRGTRLAEGKDYFTVYDFVKAHEHFKDPEWDGEPEPPDDTGGGGHTVCQTCNQRPCACDKEEVTCEECGNDPCVCDKPGSKVIEVILSDGRVRQIDSMVHTTFFDAEGKPISSEEFVQKLYGEIPKLFGNEDDLRKIWSMPSTRRQLLEKLSDMGFTIAQLEDLQKVIHAENSDLFDVLSYIAYHKDVQPRKTRASNAKQRLHDYSAKQQEFITFVLDQYIKEGVSELDDKKLPELLNLQYGSVSDAKIALGDVSYIRNMFVGFQERIYL